MSAFGLRAVHTVRIRKVTLPCNAMQRGCSRAGHACLEVTEQTSEAD